MFRRVVQSPSFGSGLIPGPGFNGVLGRGAGAGAGAGEMTGRAGWVAGRRGIVGACGAAGMGYSSRCSINRRSIRAVRRPLLFAFIAAPANRIVDSGSSLAKDRYNIDTSPAGGNAS